MEVVKGGWRNKGKSGKANKKKRKVDRAKESVASGRKSGEDIGRKNTKNKRKVKKTGRKGIGSM